MSRPTVIRISLFLATVVAVWGVLSLGSTSSDLDLEESAPSPSTFIALRTADVLDVAETQRLQQQARDSVQVQKFVSVQIQRQAETDINSVFADAASLVVLERETESVVVPSLPEPAEDDEPTEETAMLTGRVFLDINGDGVFSPDMSGDRVDTPLAGVRVTVITADEELTRQTDIQGTWTIEVPAGHAVVVYDFANGQVPNGWFHDSGEPAVLVECEAGQTCAVEDVGFVASLRPIAEVEARLTELHPNLPAGTISYLAVTASDDVIRGALREPLHLPTVQQVTLTTIRAEFGFRVEPDTLTETQLRVRSNPPPVYHVDTQLDVPGGLAVGEIVSAHLAANYLEDETATQLARETAAASVEDQLVSVREGSTIVREGDNLTQFHIDAINQTALRAGTGGTPSLGLLAVIAMMVMVMGLYLSRFRQEIWSRPRMVALLGILLLVVAASVRLTVALSESLSWYVVPAVAFGFITAILFDQRIALLMALAVGVVTAVGTFDLGLTVYAVLAAMAPIPFVSAVSSRGAFRNAVVLSSLTAAGVAAATSWFFHVGPNDQFLEVVGFAVAWAFGASVVASLVGLASLQFFESAFDITTTLSLLDLTDRNHDALQLLQEKAFGTFNHSLMVGTLADAASRAIGANPLLARAMAYYHDLGKTVNPTYFIENQFGMQNPHDLLEPHASAAILRSHVTEGVALAREFNIPTDVAQGIVSHHGDGVMRYFYEKARAKSGDQVDIDDFRHIGHKPKTAETAILMLADSLEAACRAVFQIEEPTPEAIEKVVSRIIDEKVEDGQLSESPLTLAELTQIRKAFLDSLVGHYHQRIAYPNFPGDREPST